MTCKEFEALGAEIFERSRRQPSMTELAALVRHLHECPRCHAEGREIAARFNAKKRVIVEAWADLVGPEIFRHLGQDSEG